jgi:hypothetical protein
LILQFKYKFSPKEEFLLLLSGRHYFFLQDINLFLLKPSADWMGAILVIEGMFKEVNTKHENFSIELKP